MASPKQRVLAKHPTARIRKENLANNGTFHYTVVLESGKSLATATMHGSPREAWQGAMYALNRQAMRSDD